MAGMENAGRERWNQLTQLLDRAEQGGTRALSVQEVRQLCRLYRHATIDLSRVRTDGEDPELVRYLNYLVARAHGFVYRTKPISLRPLAAFLLGGFPRLVRRHFVPILLAAGVFFFTAAASWLAVVRDPELAYSLYDESVVRYENIRLEEQAGEYRGNFEFGLRHTPLVAATIIANNIRAVVVVFALAALCCLPGLLLLVYNGRMLGTLSGLVWNHGYFIAFYSLILTHGVLEMTAFCIAAGGGLMLGWAIIAPGTLSRAAALQQAAREAFGLLAGAAGLLIVAGVLETYVTPFFSAPARWSVALASAALLIIYFGWMGRGATPAQSGSAGLPARAFRASRGT